MARPRRSAPTCAECDRPVRFAYESPTEHPDAVLAGAHNLCNACYLRARRGITDAPTITSTTEDDDRRRYEAAREVLARAAGRTEDDPQPTPGHCARPVQLVRGRGKEIDLVMGFYIACTPDLWSVRIAGQIRLFPRATWEVCPA
jgi:hypothetical protein